MGELLTEIGAFIDSPPRGVVIACCWLFVPLLTFALIQRFKRVSKGSGKAMSDLCIEGLAVFAAWAFSMLIMIGLYSIELRPAAIHSILISVSYTVGINWWLGWAKAHKPDMYNAFRTNRRADDTQEIKLP